MHDIPREQLQQIVGRYGREVLDDPRRCRALLMDFCPEYKGEINVLEMALRENVVRELTEMPQGVPRSLVVARLVRRLQDTYYLPQEAARWAVDSCVAALEGRAVEETAREFRSTVACAVLVRGWLEPDDRWRELGTTPGRVSVPPDVAVGLSSQLGDGAMGELVGDVRAFGSVQHLDLSYGQVTDADARLLGGLRGLLSLNLARTAVGDAGLVMLAQHPQMTSLNLWGCERVTDEGLGVLEAVAQLERLELGQCSQVSGHVAVRLRELSHLLELGLSETRFGDTGLRQLAGLVSLRRLDLSGTPVGGSGLAAIGPMEDLVALSLRNCVRLRPESLAALRRSALSDLALGGCGLLTDAALVYLRPLRGLTHLSLERLGIGDAGMLYLSELVALSRLDVSWTRIGDTGLARLCGLQGLRSLLLSGTRVSDAGLVRLAQLPDLAELNLSSTAVTDAALRALVAVPSLQVLDLENTGVRDAGLVHLGELPELRHLYLGGTAITDLGLDLVARLTSVKTVDLTLCRQVTRQGVEVLREAGISVTC